MLCRRPKEIDNAIGQVVHADLDPFYSQPDFVGLLLSVADFVVYLAPGCKGKTGLLDPLLPFTALIFIRGGSL